MLCFEILIEVDAEEDEIDPSGEVMNFEEAAADELERVEREAEVIDLAAVHNEQEQDPTIEMDADEEREDSTGMSIYPSPTVKPRNHQQLV